MSDSSNPEKKIIIDEDWKERARAEKEELAKKQKEAESAKTEDKSADAAGIGDENADQAGPAAEEMKWPEPSLPLLVTTLATQAMVALGLVPHPTSGKSEPDLGQAKHFIGTVELLLEKTEGNRTKEESEMIEEVLHQLRMGYVAVSKA
ncbi:MAG: DUF1844 domain-containing protein [Pirellulales bacterium]|nr:DUF1844 domain-containing protein [Pirellulales bacterium]